VSVLAVDGATGGWDGTDCSWPAALPGQPGWHMSPSRSPGCGVLGGGWRSSQDLDKQWARECQNLYSITPARWISCTSKLRRHRPWGTWSSVSRLSSEWRTCFAGSAQRLEAASSCVRGGPGWILGKISLLKEWSDIGPGCPGQWWSPHPWRGSKNMRMWHLGTWFSRHGGVGVMVGLDDLRGLFQP